MPLYGAWRKWSGTLALTTDRDFERKTLPFLRLFWPSLKQLPARGKWDAKGIDLLEWVDSGPFPCGIQCKGFEVQELGDDQIRSVLKSIESFRKSDACCDVYLVVHNRDARNKNFNDTVNAHLKELVSIGKAKRAELWDRQTFLLRTYNRLKEILDSALFELSKEMLSRFEGLFEFSRYYITEVPAAEKRLIFKRGEPCILKDVRSVDSCDISKVLLTTSEARWTLLTGIFGSGKTTAVLHSATSSGQQVIFAQCSALSSPTPAISTNVLLGEIVKSLEIFDEYEDQDREILCNIAGPTLGDLLRKAKTPYVLILDGLDENRAYSNMTGLQRLSNQLADLECPVILTTRSAHLNAMFGDFSIAFNEFSTKKGPRRNARILELRPWEKEQVLQLGESIIQGVSAAEKERLAKFLKVIDKGEYSALYGDLPFNPLFLQFILEEVAAEGLQQANRASLLGRWVKRKIYRDRNAIGRLSPNDSIDAEDFVAKMIRLMENIAYAMTYKSHDTYELGESIDAAFVTEEARKEFNDNSGQILGVLLNSVLMPQAIRRGSKLDVIFAFKVFQEYFLASYLIRRNFKADDYPETVKLFYSEIKTGALAEVC
jgi:hypothetical protein